MIPVLLTQSIIMLQDTSLVYVVGLRDFLTSAEIVASRDNRPTELYLFVAARLPGDLLQRLAARQPPAPEVRAVIEIKNVSKWYGTFQVLERLLHAHRQGRGGRHLRTLRLGQEHADQVHQRPRAVHQGRRSRSTASRSGDATTNLPKLRSRIGMVFQNFELFPHMTAAENIVLAQQKVLGRRAWRGSWRRRASC